MSGRAHRCQAKRARQSRRQSRRLLRRAETCIHPSREL